MDQTKQNQKMTYGTHKYTSYKDTPFMKDKNLIYKEYSNSLAIYDKYPVCVGHLLFIPKTNNTESIKEAFEYALNEGETQIQEKKIDGYHLGMNLHLAGGQSILWPHVHFIPRCYDDSGTEEIGSVRLARVGGKTAISYKNHPQHEH